MKTRDPYFDNVKFVLIFMVVLSHFGFEQKDLDLHMHAMLNVLACFVVPAFALISGHFSRNIKSQRKEDITHLLIPYLLLEIIHLIFTKLTGLGKGDVHFETPTYHNWYFLALFFWRLFLPYYSFVKPLYGILISLAIGFAIGFIRGFNDFLDLHRTFYFMPLFLMGYYWKDMREKIQKLSAYRYFFVLIFIFSIVTVYFLSLQGEAEAGKLLYLYAPMFGFGGDYHNFLLRVPAFVWALVTGTSLLIIIPKKKTIFTEAGTRTMYVYLFHMFIVWPIVKLGFEYRPGISELIALLLSALITVILSSRPAEKIFGPLVNPADLKIFKK